MIIIKKKYETKSTPERPRESRQNAVRLWWQSQVFGTKKRISISVDKECSSGIEMKGVESG